MLQSFQMEPRGAMTGLELGWQSLSPGFVLTERDVSLEQGVVPLPSSHQSLYFLGRFLIQRHFL